MKLSPLLLSLACLLSVALALQPGLDDGEFLVDTSGGHIEEDLVVAFDGTNFLVVWEDWRNLYTDIFGTRITPQGEVLDPAGFAVTTGASLEMQPAVAFGNKDFLVAWEDFRSGTGMDIYACRVTPQGRILDSLGIAVCALLASQYSPAVSSDGTNYLVVWEDLRLGAESDLYGARVTPQGTVLDPRGIPISAAAGDQRSPSIAFDGTNFLVVWEDYRDSGFGNVYAARVTPAGAVLDREGIRMQTSSYTYHPAASFDGTNFLVVWEDYRGGADVYGSRVTPAGTVLDPRGIAIAVSTEGESSPAVCFNGTDLLVAWREGPDPRDIFGARVSPQGSVFDVGPIVRQEGDQNYPALARGAGDQMLLVYEGWAGTVNGKTYDTLRAWGKMNPRVAVEETPHRPTVASLANAATVVRGMLFVGVENRGQSLGAPASDSARDSPRFPRPVLLDIAGRKVLDLKPGANDISGLAPGVYFIEEKSVFSSQHSGRRAVGGERSAVSVRKVIVTR